MQDRRHAELRLNFLQLHRTSGLPWRSGPSARCEISPHHPVRRSTAESRFFCCVRGWGLWVGSCSVGGRPCLRRCAPRGTVVLLPVVLHAHDALWVQSLRLLKCVLVMESQDQRKRSHLRCLLLNSAFRDHLRFLDLTSRQGTRVITDSLITETGPAEWPLRNIPRSGRHATEPTRRQTPVNVRVKDDRGMRRSHDATVTTSASGARTRTRREAERSTGKRR